MPAPFPSIHATAILLGEDGVLIRGPSGSGKTTSALSLMHHMKAMMRFASLVADDRVLLESRGDRLIARPPASIAGLMECRGLGVVRTAHEPAAVLRLVVDLVPMQAVPRVPEPQECSTDLFGVILPRLQAAPGPSLIPLVLMALEAKGTLDCDTGKTCVCAAT